MITFNTNSRNLECQAAQLALYLDQLCRSLWLRRTQHLAHLGTQNGHFWFLSECVFQVCDSICADADCALPKR